MMNALFLFSIALLLPACASAADLEAKEHIYVVHDYKYEPDDSNESPETGLSICGTRCNAMSDNVANYIRPGGWRLTKIASDQEREVELPSLVKGTCICIGDEFRIDWYNPDPDGRSSSKPIPFRSN